MKTKRTVLARSKPRSLLHEFLAATLKSTRRSKHLTGLLLIPDSVPNGKETQYALKWLKKVTASIK